MNLLLGWLRNCGEDIKFSVTATTAPKRLNYRIEIQSIRSGMGSPKAGRLVTAHPSVRESHLQSLELFPLVMAMHSCSVLCS
jgi:hypothetical protein